MQLHSHLLDDAARYEDMEPRHCYAEAAEMTLHWVELGEKTDSPPLILLHGLNDWHGGWIQIATELARTRHVLIPDLPGHGWSERPDTGYELHWYTHVMASWLDLLDIEQADFAGHSFGGGVAQMLMLGARQRVRKLALLASGGLGSEIALELRLAAIPWLVEYLGQPFMALGTRLALWELRQVLSNNQIEELSIINSQRGSARAFARTVSDVINWRGQTRSFYQRVHEIDELPPIAVFWGDNDRIIPIKHAYELIEAVDGILLKVFEGCGHYPHYERPKSVVDAFQEFFDTPVAPAAKIKTFMAGVTESGQGRSAACH